MAEVYVGHMQLPGGVQRRVALKRVHAHLSSDSEFVEMFLDEARVTGQLSHPCIVPLIDVLEHDGELVMVLEHVAGWDLGTLQKRLEVVRKDFPVPAALFVAHELCACLGYVHAATDASGKPLQIVHRDVSPSNVVVATDGSVRLLDFGIAKAVSRVTKTATDVLKGKLSYMAPEQLGVGTIDGRTDLFAVGIVLFEMLTGRRAIDPALGPKRYELVRAPSHVAPSTYRADLPAEVDALVLGLLAASPDARPADGYEVARAVEAIVASIGGSGRSALRELVRTTMGAPERPVDERRSVLDRAIAAAAGVSLGDTGGGTAPLSPPGAAPVHVPVSRASSPGETSPAVGAMGSGGQGGATASSDATAGPTIAEPLPSGMRASARRLPRTAILAAVGLPIVGLAVWGAVAASGGPDEAGVPSVASGAAMAPGFVRITSTPQGAAIAIDGETLSDRTPAVVESSPGEHEVRVTLDDHEPASRSVRVAPGVVASIDVPLTRVAGRLVVTSEPSGAAVAIDGEPAGRTPLELDELPRAAVTVRVTADGREPFAAVAALDREARVTIHAALEERQRRGYGSLDVSTTPWARVEVRGRVLAESTPAVGLRLPAGRHTITLVNPRLGLRVRRVVRIREGETTRVVERLQ